MGGSAPRHWSWAKSGTGRPCQRRAAAGGTPPGGATRPSLAHLRGATESPVRHGHMRTLAHASGFCRSRAMACCYLQNVQQLLGSTADNKRQPCTRTVRYDKDEPTCDDHAHSARFLLQGLVRRMWCPGRGTGCAQLKKEHMSKRWYKARVPTHLWNWSVEAPAAAAAAGAGVALHRAPLPGGSSSGALQWP